MNIKQIVTILAILTMVAVCVQPVAAASDDPATNYFNLAERSLATGDYEKALEYFDKALASDTTSIARGDTLMYTYKDKSGVLTELGRYEEAIKTADIGLVQFHNESGLWNNKGYAYYRMGKYNEAVDAYNSALRIDPGYVKGWINKGNALMKAGRTGEAADAYNKALALDPGNNDATAGLADAQKAAQTMTIVIVLILVIAAGLVIWYVKFRRPDDKKSVGKGKEKK